MSKKGLFLKYLEIVIVFMYLESLLLFTLINLIVGIDERWISTPNYKFSRHATCFICFEKPSGILLESFLFTTLAMFGYNFQYGCTYTGDDKMYCRAVVKYEKPTALGFKHNLYWMCVVPWTIIFTRAWLENLGQFLDLLSMYASYVDNITSAGISLLCVLIIQLMLGSEMITLAVNGYCAMRNVYKLHFERKPEQLDRNILEDIFTPD